RSISFVARFVATRASCTHSSAFARHVARSTPDIRPYPVGIEPAVIPQCGTLQSVPWNSGTDHQMFMRMPKHSKRTPNKASDIASWTVTNFAGKGVRFGSVEWPADDPEGAREHAIKQMNIASEHAFKITVRRGH